jgi:hypothetical protein
MYKLYKVGEWTETWGTPACISPGVDISPSTENLNLPFERKKIISIIKMIEK